MLAFAATVLYEDQQGPRKGFGLHELVLALVADAVQLDRHQFKNRIDGNPRKGNGELKKACGKTSMFSGSCRKVIAVFDLDQVCKCYGLDSSTHEDEIIRIIREQSDDADRLEVVLLDQNTESVIQAVGKCDESVDQNLLNRALEKHLDARDRVLIRAAAGPKAVRDCIQQRVRGLERLCALLVETLRAA